MGFDIYLAAIIVYLVVIIGVGVYRSRSVKNQDDFMVAGRSVSALFLVTTLVCTWIGSGSLFGGAGRAYRGGFSALWMSAGAWVGIAIVYFLAPRVRRIAQYTVPDILEIRYSPAARVMGTIAIIVAYLTIASYQFIGGGRLLNIVLPQVEPWVGQVITCGLVVAVVALAGMRSIVSLDLINGILITVGIVIAAPLVLGKAGGWSELTTTLPETHFTLFGTFGWIAALGLFFPTLLLLLGESGMYQKFMSAKSEIDARKAVIGMIVGVILIETVLDSTAIFGAGIYWGDPMFHTAEGGYNDLATETILLQLARHDLPVWAGILLLAGALAIIFSTAATFLMIPSTNLARDIYQRFLNPEATPENVVRFQRFAVIGLAIVSLVVTNFFESILDMALYAYTMVGAAVTPAMLAAFLWRRVTPAAGTASVAAGVIVTAVCGVLLNTGVIDWPFDYIVYPAAGASFFCLIVGSYVTAPSPEEKWKPFWTPAEADEVGR